MKGIWNFKGRDEEVEEIEECQPNFQLNKPLADCFLHFLAIEGPTPPWELTRKANILSLRGKILQYLVAVFMLEAENTQDERNPVPLCQRDSGDPLLEVRDNPYTCCVCFVTLHSVFQSCTQQVNLQQVIPDAA